MRAAPSSALFVLALFLSVSAFVLYSAFTSGESSLYASHMTDRRSMASTFAFLSIPFVSRKVSSKVFTVSGLSSAQTFVTSIRLVASLLAFFPPFRLWELLR